MGERTRFDVLANGGDSAGSTTTHALARRSLSVLIFKAIAP